jgi:hypothetical protein
LAHVMLFDVFAAIALVPFKPLDPREIKHVVYYYHIR